MDAWAFLIELNKELDCVPSIEKKLPVSGGQIKRMLENKAVTINGKKPGPKDQVEFPIFELIFCKGSKSQVTLMGGSQSWTDWHSKAFPNCKADQPCSRQH